MINMAAARGTTVAQTYTQLAVAAAHMHTQLAAAAAKRRCQGGPALENDETASMLQCRCRAGQTLEADEAASMLAPQLRCDADHNALILQIAHSIFAGRLRNMHECSKDGAKT